MANIQNPPEESFHIGKEVNLARVMINSAHRRLHQNYLEVTPDETARMELQDAYERISDGIATFTAYCENMKNNGL